MDEQQLRRENARLREIIGSWRRKSQDKHSRRIECLREGFSVDYYGKRHYKVFIVGNIPGDLPIRDVLQELKKGFLREVKPYHFSRCDYSKKYDSWLVEVDSYEFNDIDMFNDLD